MTAPKTGEPSMVEMEAMRARVERLERRFDKVFCRVCDNYTARALVAECTRAGCPYDRAKAQAGLPGARP